MNKLVKLSECVNSACTGLDAIQKAPIVDYKTSLRCLRIQDISQSKKYDYWGYTSANSNCVSDFLIKKNDLFVARTGSTIGCSFFSNIDMNSVFNNGLIRLRFNQYVVPKYLYYLFQTTNLRTYIANVSMASATQPNIKISDLLDYVFFLPNMKNQQHIVNIPRKELLKNAIQNLSISNY